MAVACYVGLLARYDKEVLSDHYYPDGIFQLAWRLHSLRASKLGIRAMLAATRRASSSVGTFACIAALGRVAVNVGQRLPVGIADDIGAGYLFGAPRCDELILIKVGRRKIDVTYGDGKGEYDLYAEAFRSVRLLDVVAARLENELAWRMPFALEMQTCGAFNTSWNESTRKLTLCYELAADFAELCRNYNDKLMASANPKAKSKPKRK
jgi:putative metallopeptidase DUF4344